MLNRDLLTIGVLVGAGYIVYTLIEKARAPIDKAADWISRPIAYIVSKLTLPGRQHVAGGVVFQDGGYVSWDAIIDGGSQIDRNSRFVWKGRTYKALTPRRSDGNYAAVPI